MCTQMSLSDSNDNHENNDEMMTTIITTTSMQEYMKFYAFHML